MHNYVYNVVLFKQVVPVNNTVKLRDKMHNHVYNVVSFKQVVPVNNTVKKLRDKIYR